MNSPSARTGDETPRVLPSGTTDSWRTWVMTGARKAPIDRRRVRGAHRGLKKLLVEGINGDGEHAQPWKDFSGAMVRQSVDEAMNSLPAEQKQVVKLAYFGGLSNQEIASRLGISVAGVHRRLREALATVSAFVERGQAAGRRAVYSIATWLAARWIVDHAHRASGAASAHVVQAATAVAIGFVAAAALANPSAPGALSSPFHGGGVAAGSHAAEVRAATVQASARVAPQTAKSAPDEAPEARAVPEAPDAPSQPDGEPLKVRHAVETASLTLHDIPRWR